MFKILPLIPSHLDKVLTPAVEKLQLMGEALLAMINSTMSFTTETTGGRNNMESSETIRKVFAVLSQFSGMLQGEISKIF